ncbi:MAG: DUF4040 domain-containing protein, partial [Anaerolineae bacterium]|nr:DUF4040 domain-containing protein [Anaerolineae bacterium]
VDHDVHHPLGDDAYDYSRFHSLPPLMVAGPGALAVLSVVIGFGVGPLLDPLVGSALGKDIHLHLFPPDGVNLAFALSMTALAVGAAAFAVRSVWLRWPFPALASGPQVYRWVVGRVERLADLLLRTQGGKVRYYLAAILISVVILLIPALISADQLGVRAFSITILGAADVLKLILLVLALGATLASIIFAKHLLAALSLSIAGYAIGGIFLLEPAPDVALVQFLVETLITVLLIIILARTSERERRTVIARVWEQTRRGLVRDVAISATLGAAVTVMALAAVSSRPTPNPIAAWHLANAYPLLGVNDVVAGIITDFRGTDTLIEITVFGVAALGILTLLARPNPGRTMQWFRRTPATPAPTEPPAAKDAIQEDAERPDPFVYRSHLNSPITRLAAVPLLPISMMIALAHILYAGAAPGDGFTAGVISGLGVTLWYVVFGYEQVKQRLRWLHPAGFIGAGLLIAFTNAILPLFFGRDFLALTAISGVSIADIKLASSLVFEIGIWLAVFGGISAILEAISHPKEVEPV